MKTHRLLVCILVLGTAGLISFGQEAVLNPSKRQTTLDLAAQLLAARENPTEKLPAELVDPFNPLGFAGPAKPSATVRQAGRVNSDLDLLERIAPHITPSGALMLNGEPVLLFREKKLKVGDTLTITFEGATYMVVITAVDRSSFKIRLNREEITRPIKSRKVP
jgi:ribosomal 50S subunit-recycling heat shock protein